MEDFRQHPTYKNVYANRYGQLKVNGKVLKGTVTASGYRQHMVDKKSKITHRLICEAFLGRLLGRDEIVNHKNSDKLDNSLENLEIGSTTCNIRHHFRVKYETITNNSLTFEDTNISGEKNPQAKLTKDQARELILLTREGWTNDELGERFGLHSRYVSLIRHKKRWKNLWKEMGLQFSTTIPSGSSAASLGRHETETSLQMRDMI